MQLLSALLMQNLVSFWLSVDTLILYSWALAVNLNHWVWWYLYSCLGANLLECIAKRILTIMSVIHALWQKRMGLHTLYFFVGRVFVCLCLSVCPSVGVSDVCGQAHGRQELSGKEPWGGRNAGLNINNLLGQDRNLDSEQDDRLSSLVQWRHSRLWSQRWPVQYVRITALARPFIHHPTFMTLTLTAEPQNHIWIQYVQ